MVAAATSPLRTVSLSFCGSDSKNQNCFNSLKVQRSAAKLPNSQKGMRSSFALSYPNPPIEKVTRNTIIPTCTQTPVRDMFGVLVWGFGGHPFRACMSKRFSGCSLRPPAIRDSPVQRHGSPSLHPLLWGRVEPHGLLRSDPSSSSFLGGGGWGVVSLFAFCSGGDCHSLGQNHPSNAKGKGCMACLATQFVHWDVARYKTSF